MKKQFLLRYRSISGEKILLVFGRYPVIDPRRKYSKYPALILYVDDIKVESIALDEVPESLLDQLDTLRETRASSETLQEVLAEVDELYVAPGAPFISKTPEPEQKTPEDQERLKLNGRTKAWDYLESLGLKPSWNPTPRLKAILARQAKQFEIRAQNSRKKGDDEASSSLVLA